MKVLSVFKRNDKEPDPEYTIERNWRNDPIIKPKDIFIHCSGKVIEVLDIAINPYYNKRNIVYHYINSTSDIHWIRDELSFFNTYKKNGIKKLIFEKANIVSSDIYLRGFDPILASNIHDENNLSWRLFERYDPDYGDYVDIKIKYIYEFHGETYIIYDEYYYGEAIRYLGIQDDTRHVIKLSDWFTTVKDKNGALHPKFRKTVD